MQRVKAKKQPKIEVMDKTVFETEPTISTPEWDMEINDLPLDPELMDSCSFFTIIVKLPMLVSGLGIIIEGNCEFVSITAGKLYKLQLWMPKKVDIDSASATFSCLKRELRLKLPIQTGENVEMESSAPEVTLKPVNLPAHDLLYDIV